jgi:hypothetical protein
MPHAQIHGHEHGHSYMPLYRPLASHATNPLVGQVNGSQYSWSVELVVNTVRTLDSNNSTSAMIIEHNAQCNCNDHDGSNTGMNDSRGIRMQVMIKSNMYPNRKIYMNTPNQLQILMEGPNTPHACVPTTTATAKPHHFFC